MYLGITVKGIQDGLPSEEDYHSSDEEYHSSDEEYHSPDEREDVWMQEKDIGEGEFGVVKLFVNQVTLGLSLTLSTGTSCIIKQDTFTAVK